MVAANASVLTEQEAAGLPGERWLPTDSLGSTRLRVPREGTLDDLIHKHDAFLQRLVRDSRGNESFNPVPPLSVYRVVGYRRSTDPAPLPFAAFKLLKADASGYRVFETTRCATVVAGMVRCALGKLAQRQQPFNWDNVKVARIVLGHDQNGRAIRLDPSEPRFAYLPLPTFEHRGQDRAAHHVAGIRRVLVVGTPGMEREIKWVQRVLSGTELIREENEGRAAILSLIPSRDWVIQQYCLPSPTWVTVTPVIVPGYDDRNDAKMGRLIRKALYQAGFPHDLVNHAELDWRGTGYLPGVDSASHYRRPRNFQEAPVCHVKICWRDAQGRPHSVPGPLAVGSGRFRGLGLFAALHE